MTSPFVWKSIASTFPLPLGSEEYPQPWPGLLDRLRQQSQLARRKNNDLITWPTISNVCLFVCWCCCCCCCCCCFNNWTKERVERLRFSALRNHFLYVVYVTLPRSVESAYWEWRSAISLLYKTDRRCTKKFFISVYDAYWNNFMLPHC